MKCFTSPLRNVKVASPCPADWDRMIGDERVRFCGQCELNVYNLSAMSEAPAELERFYSETVEPLVAYDDQYETELEKLLTELARIDRVVLVTGTRGEQGEIGRRHERRFGYLISEGQL